MDVEFELPDGFLGVEKWKFAEGSIELKEVIDGVQTEKLMTALFFGNTFPHEGRALLGILWEGDSYDRVILEFPVSLLPGEHAMSGVVKTRYTIANSQTGEVHDYFSTSGTLKLEAFDDAKSSAKGSFSCLTDDERVAVKARFDVLSSK